MHVWRSRWYACIYIYIYIYTYSIHTRTETSTEYTRIQTGGHACVAHRRGRVCKYYTRICTIHTHARTRTRTHTHTHTCTHTHMSTQYAHLAETQSELRFVHTPHPLLQFGGGGHFSKHVCARVWRYVSPALCPPPPPCPLPPHLSPVTERNIESGRCWGTKNTSDNIEIITQRPLQDSRLAC